MPRTTCNWYQTKVWVSRENFSNHQSFVVTHKSIVNFNPEESCTEPLHSKACHLLTAKSLEWAASTASHSFGGRRERGPSHSSSNSINNDSRLRSLKAVAF
jgi:hypothetical protein